MTIIAADASVCWDDASWGAVVRLPGRELRLRGRLDTGNSCEAELLAVHRALARHAAGPAGGGRRR